MSRAKARQELGRAVQVTKSEIEDALKAVDAGRSDVTDRASDTVAKGRKRANQSGRKAKRRAAKARRRIEKALPDLPSTDTVTRRRKRRSKKPLVVVVLGALAAGGYAFLKGSK